MSLELESSIVKLDSILQEETAQNIVEGDIIVPDVKPDVISILQADAEVKVNNKEHHKDMVVLRGVITFKILYMSDDPSRLLCSIDHSINFDQTVDVENSNSNIKSYVTCKIEHIDYTVLNGRKLNVKAILNSNVKVVKNIEVAAISAIQGSDNIQVRTQQLNMYNPVEYDSIETVANYEVEVPIGKPAIKEVLRTDVFIKDKDIKATGGKAIIKGNIDIKSLYISDIDETSIDFISSEVPFSEVIDITDQDSGVLDVQMDVEGISCNVKQDDDGDSRLLDYELLINYKPHSYERQSFEVISDAYGLSSKLELEKSTVKVNNIVGDSKVQYNVRDTLQLFEMPPVKQIYNISCTPIITDIRVEKDKANIEGVIETSIIYLSQSEERPVVNYECSIPFNNLVEVKGAAEAMKSEAKVDIDGYTYELVGEKELEIKFSATTCIRVLSEDVYNIITKVDQVPIDSRIRTLRPSMIVYYVQNGDTLWDIAKRYVTTINELISINNIENQDGLYTGQQLLIPKVY